MRVAWSKIRGVSYIFRRILTLKLYHISNYSRLTEPKNHNIIHSGFIFSLIQLKHIEVYDFVGRTKLPRGLHAACGP